MRGFDQRITKKFVNWVIKLKFIFPLLFLLLIAIAFRGDTLMTSTLKGGGKGGKGGEGEGFSGGSMSPPPPLLRFFAKPPIKNDAPIGNCH